MKDVVKVAITKSAAFRLTKTGTRCKIYDRVAKYSVVDGFVVNNPKIPHKVL
jgi:hypothetical protein